MFNIFFQVLKVDLVLYFLKLFEGIGFENLDSLVAIKVQIVKVFKVMIRSLQYGEQVSLYRGGLDLLIIVIFKVKSFGYV